MLRFFRRSFFAFNILGGRVFLPRRREGVLLKQGGKGFPAQNVDYNNYEHPNWHKQYCASVVSVVIFFCREGGKAF